MEDNIFTKCRRIRERSQELGLKEIWLAEQPDNGRPSSSYRIFSSYPDLGRNRNHADCTWNAKIMVGYIGDAPIGLGEQLTAEIIDGYVAGQERYGERQQNILYRGERFPRKIPANQGEPK